MEKISAEEFVRQTSAKSKSERPGQTKKYRNTKVEIDGIKFDSKLEAARWQKLKMLEQAGVISELQRQVPFELLPKFIDSDGNKVREIRLFIDFTYAEKGRKYAEDCKAVIADDAALKIKFFKYMYREYKFRIVRRA